MIIRSGKISAKDRLVRRCLLVDGDDDDNDDDDDGTFRIYIYIYKLVDNQEHYSKIN